MGTQKVVVTLSIAVYISSKLPSSVWKVNGGFFHILLKKIIILNLNLHESLGVTISHNFHFDIKIVHM